MKCIKDCVIYVSVVCRYVLQCSDLIAASRENECRHFICLPLPPPYTAASGSALVVASATSCTSNPFQGMWSENTSSCVPSTVSLLHQFCCDCCVLCDCVVSAAFTFACSLFADVSCILVVEGARGAGGERSRQSLPACTVLLAIICQWSYACVWVCMGVLHFRWHVCWTLLCKVFLHRTFCKHCRLKNVHLNMRMKHLV